MFDPQSYFRVLTSIVAALTTLLGSVGIFVSLTVQRRVERLQEILEEFLDLSYHTDTNITGKMYKLIEKYQMHYLFPNTPGRIIIQYINLTIIVVVIAWGVILSVGIRGSWEAVELLYLTPLLMALGILVFYRYLLKNVIYPFDNSLMSPLIPPPVYLRSVSFLSRYVNVSVKSILRQARLRLLIKDINEHTAKVILKEELSFDDYFYYLLILTNQTPVFGAYGELQIDFGIEAITGKPIPAAKNINIPLGYVSAQVLQSEEYEARLLIFPRGEKHPIEYFFTLAKKENIIIMTGDPEISINYMITYQMDSRKFQIIQENTDIPFFRRLVGSAQLDKKRHFCGLPKDSQVHTCDEEIFID